MGLFGDYFGQGAPEDEEQASKRATGSLISQGMGIASNMATTAMDSENTDYNLKYGSQSEAAKGIKDAVGSAIPIFGAVNSVMNVGQSLLNKGNNYDKYGYNRNQKHGAMYMGLGGFFDPAGSAMRVLEEGGEGSGARALLSLTGFGGIAQYNYEQKQALERKRVAELKEDSDWKLNQFNFTPNLDV